MNRATASVKEFLDSHIFHNYEDDIDEFKSVVTKMLSDVDDGAKEELILIALMGVDWAFLHQREYERMILATKEAEENRKATENLGDIPF